MQLARQVRANVPRDACPTCHSRASFNHPGRHAVQKRQRRLNISKALVLVPTGDGSTDHLDEDVSMPSEISLQEGSFELGRDASAQIVIPLPTVSSRHALLKIAGDSLSVTDLNSTNGTYITENELVPMEAEDLNIGDEVIFGDMYLAKFKLQKIDSPAAPSGE